MVSICIIWIRMRLDIGGKIHMISMLYRIMSFIPSLKMQKEVCGAEAILEDCLMFLMHCVILRITDPVKDIPGWKEL